MSKKTHLLLIYDGDDHGQPWKLCWSIPDGIGYRIEQPPVATRATKREAQDCRRELYDALGLYPVPTEPASPEARESYARRRAEKHRTRQIAKLAREILEQRRCCVSAALAAARALYVAGET